MKTRRIISVLLALLTAAIIVSFVLGIRPYVLQSDSMSPDYPENSLVFLNSGIRVNDLNPGDVIGVMVDHCLIFHRLDSIRTDPETGEKAGFLYGDAQGKEAGREVSLSNSTLIGREVLTVPGIGAFVSLLLDHGTFVWIALLILLFASFIPWEKLVRR